MNNQNNEKANYVLIDDDASFGKIIERCGKDAGINITHVESIRELKNIEYIKNFDAILLDYDLGDMTGFEVAEFLELNLKDRPVVMISNTNRPCHDTLANLSNIVGFVTKWGKPQDFIDKTMQTIEERPGIKISA